MSTAHPIARRSVEAGKETVAGRGDLFPPVAVELGTDEAVMLSEQIAPSAIAQFGRSRG